mmetsp:Transcript_1149/g.2511  ORF Transcript_1149/g.2511 Transcript_1149/m.2511 type:complete len:128 (+) Transcript_1149:818-1201(+)
MGETAVNGAETPRYNPRTPSLRNVLESMPKTELELVAAPALAVCMRTLTRSRGWPTRTQHAPPTPPEMKDLRADSDLGDGSTAFSSRAGGGEAGMLGFVSSLVAMVEVDSEDVANDMMIFFIMLYDG